MTIAAGVLAALIALACILTGAPKVVGAAVMRTRAEHVRVPFAFYRVIGVLELLAAAGVIVGMWFPLLAALAAGGLVLLMIGAVGAHARVGDRVAGMLPAIVVGVVAAAALLVALGRL